MKTDVLAALEIRPHKHEIDEGSFWNFDIGKCDYQDNKDRFCLTLAPFVSFEVSRNATTKGYACV